MNRYWAWPILFMIVSIGWLARGDTLELVGGGTLSGEIVSANPQGLVVKKEDGSFSPRTPWTNFTQNALNELAKNPKTKSFVELYVEPPEEQSAKKKAEPEITVKIPPRLDRPDRTAGIGALFKSPLSIVLLLIIYAANIYAGYEVSIFRNYPAAAVCAVAAVAPIVGPALFICLPTRMQAAPQEGAETLATEHQQQHLVVPHEGMEEEAAAAAAHEAAPAEAGSALPQPIVYGRGYYSFNRRFFETKMAGFMRMVPSDAEKDMLIHMKSSRGQHVGTRIVRLMPNELYLHVTKGGASQDVMIPYNEIAEIQIRHKDLG